QSTISASEPAEDAGVEYLEFDQPMTADDARLVTHDANINREVCTPTPGIVLVGKAVRGQTHPQARHIDCGSKSRAIYPDAEKRAAGMPALEEVFIRFKDDKRVRYFIETKLPRAGAPGRPVDTTLCAAKVDQLVRKYGLEDRVVLQSFD